MTITGHTNPQKKEKETVKKKQSGSKWRSVWPTYSEEPDRVKSEEDSSPQQQEQVQDVVVEFMFSSMHTRMVSRDGCMVQITKTGRCKLKEGTTQTKGKAKFR